MNGKIPAHVFEWAKRAKATGAVAALNKKWGGRIPRRGSSDFVEYIADVERCNELMLRVLLECKGGLNEKA